MGIACALWCALNILGSPSFLFGGDLENDKAWLDQLVLESLMLAGGWPACWTVGYLVGAKPEVEAEDESSAPRAPPPTIRSTASRGRRSSRAAPPC